MELSYLKEFITLSETGNYLEAAEELYISQPSLSRHIKAMEDELGTQLFTRSTRRVSLSEFGRVFLPYATRIVKLQEEYEEKLFQYKSGFQDTLSIGSIPSLAQYGILDELVRFRSEEPSYSLNLIEADPIRLESMVRDGELELAFTRCGAEPPEQLTLIPYTSDVLVAVVSDEHPLAERKQIALKDLKNEILLTLSNDTYMYRLCTQVCRKAGFEPKIGHTGRRSDNLLAMAAKGMGVALLTRSPIAGSTIEHIHMLNIVPKVETSIALVYRKGSRLSPAAKAFAALIRRQRR